MTVAAPTIPSANVTKAHAWFVWALSVTFVIYYFSFQTGYAIVNVSVQRDLALTVAQIATVAAVYTWVFAFCQFLSGALLDRLGANRVIPPAIALVTVGVFLFANAESYGMLLLSQLTIAIGACTGFVGAGYIGGQWFGFARFSFMFGLVQFAAAFFSAFNQNLLSLTLEWLSWRELFNYVGLFGIALAIIGAIYIRNPKPVPAMRKGGGAFFADLLSAIFAVAKIPHVWIAAAYGALCFGTMLALGVVWAPKLLAARGLDPATANWSASFLWFGLAAGCFVVPAWSDALKRRKLPIIVCTAIQVLALLALLHAPEVGVTGAMLLCAIFGAANASHMLAFSTAADVVEPSRIGTSAAIVNGIMFLFGGLMIQRPGVRIGQGLEAGLQAGSLDLAQYAAWPMTLALLLALAVAAFMRETYRRDD
ncbi:MAG: transporter [Xanthobacteraceae bacterium]|jgi:MFS family permease|nr:transporter [Xanthobacteraceae bacterium]